MPRSPKPHSRSETHLTMNVVESLASFKGAPLYRLTERRHAPPWWQRFVSNDEPGRRSSARLPPTTGSSPRAGTLSGPHGHL